MGRNFIELLNTRQAEGKDVCVGLDSDLDKIPATVMRETDAGAVVNFNCAIVDATTDLVCAYKPNIAFYEALGARGIEALVATVSHVRSYAPNVPVIGDMKRGDIDNTNLGYVKAAFDYFGFDAMTVPPYMGGKSLQPFLDMKDKGIMVLCRTSNKGAGEFQDLYTLPFDPGAKPDDLSAEEWLDKIREESMMLYLRVARNVVTDWNENGNCGLVVGAVESNQHILAFWHVRDLVVMLRACTEESFAFCNAGCLVVWLRACGKQLGSGRRA